MERITLTTANGTTICIEDVTAPIMERPTAEPQAVPEAPKQAAPKATKKTTKRRKPQTVRKSKTTGKSGKAAKLAEIRAASAQGNHAEAVELCKAENWDPELTVRKSFLAVQTTGKSETTRKSGGKNKSAPSPKAKADRPVDSAPTPKVKQSKESPTQRRDREVRTKISDLLQTYGIDVDEILVDFIVKPHRKHTVVCDADMLLDTWVQLTELEESKLMGDGTDPEVIRMVMAAQDYADGLATKAGLC